MDCVFCNIAAGKIPARIIKKDDDFIAFLSANPVYEGMTIVIPRKHYGSYVYKTMSDQELGQLHAFAKKVALVLDKALGSERCVQVMEGLDVDHAHLKLFPKYKGVTHAIVEKETWEDLDKINKVADKIRKEAEGK